MPLSDARTEATSDLICRLASGRRMPFANETSVPLTTLSVCHITIEPPVCRSHIEHKHGIHHAKRMPTPRLVDGAFGRPLFDKLGIDLDNAADLRHADFQNDDKASFGGVLQRP